MTRHFCFSACGVLVSLRGVSTNPVYAFFVTPKSLAPFFLRITLAVVFFYHGTQKAFGWFDGDGWQQTIALWNAAEGFRLPYFLAALLIIAELAVSLSLLLGFLTRLAALVVVVIMACALMFIYGGTTFEAVEYPLVLMAVGLALAFTGGGYLSMDRAISVNLLPQVG